MRDSLADERVGAWHFQHILGCASRQVNEEEQIVVSLDLLQIVRLRPNPGPRKR